MISWPHIDIMRRIAEQHGMTLAELRAPDRIPERYQARRIAAKRLHTERGLSSRIIARLMNRTYTSVEMMLNDDKRARKNGNKLNRNSD